MGDLLIMAIVGAMFAAVIIGPFLYVKNWQSFRTAIFLGLAVQAVLLFVAFSDSAANEGAGFLHFVTFEPMLLSPVLVVLFKGWSWSNRKRPSLWILIPVAAILVPASFGLHYEFLFAFN